MKCAIVYYSMGGNVKSVVDTLQNQIDADTIRLEPIKAYPDKGVRKFLWGGKSAVVAEKPELLPYCFEAKKYDRIIFGFPVWASNIAPPLRTFVTDQASEIKGKDMAAFACQSGNGAQKAFQKLKDCLGIKFFSAEMVLIDQKDKPNEENERKIRDFVKAIL